MTPSFNCSLAGDGDLEHSSGEWPTLLNKRSRLGCANAWFATCVSDACSLRLFRFAGVRSDRRRCRFLSDLDAGCSREDDGGGNEEASASHEIGDA